MLDSAACRADAGFEPAILPSEDFDTEIQLDLKDAVSDRHILHEDHITDGAVHLVVIVEDKAECVGAVGRGISI
jgi:hypothetical protein